MQEGFDYWRRTIPGKPEAKLTNERRQAVLDRLGEGYTVDQIKRAVDGCLLDPWHQGENNYGRKFDNLTDICRSGSKVEELAALAGANNYDEWERRMNAPSEPSEPDPEVEEFNRKAERNWARAWEGHTEDEIQAILSRDGPRAYRERLAALDNA